MSSARSGRGRPDRVNVVLATGIVHDHQIEEHLSQEPVRSGQRQTTIGDGPGLGDQDANWSVWTGMVDRQARAPGVELAQHGPGHRHGKPAHDPHGLSGPTPPPPYVQKSGPGDRRDGPARCPPPGQGASCTGRSGPVESAACHTKS